MVGHVRRELSPETRREGVAAARMLGMAICWSLVAWLCVGLAAIALLRGV